MKKAISIILVLIMAFAFTITALADDVVALPPLDAGYDEDGNPQNIDVEFDPDTLPDDLDNVATDWWGGWYWPDWVDLTAEQRDNWLANQEQWLLNYLESDAFDPEISFNAIQWFLDAEVYEFDPSFDFEGWWDNFWDNIWYVGFDWHDFWENNESPWDSYIVDRNLGVGGWVTISNSAMDYNTVNAILQWFENDEIGEFRLITDLVFDEATGTWSFYVDDFGFWSMFWALIERGVDPETAANVAAGRSPATADNSIHVGIILLVVLLAGAATVVIYKKVRNHE